MMPSIINAMTYTLLTFFKKIIEEDLKRLEKAIKEEEIDNEPYQKGLYAYSQRKK